MESLAKYGWVFMPLGLLPVALLYLPQIQLCSLTVSDLDLVSSLFLLVLYHD